MAILNQVHSRTIPLSKAKYIKNTLYQVQSPIQLVGYFIYKEMDNDNVVISKKISFGFKNDSDQKVIAIKGVFEQKDPFGDSLGELNYSLIEIENFGPGIIQGETLFMECNLSTTNITFRIDQVIFEGSSKWVAENPSYLVMDVEKKPIEEQHLNTMKYAWNLESSNFTIRNLYTENEHFYHCPCGNINHISKDACSICKTPKVNAKAFETVEIAQIAIQKMAKEVFNKFNTLFPDAIVIDSNQSIRFNDNAVLFDADPLKKLREYATYWKGVHPIVKDEIKKTTAFINYIETLRNKLLKEENAKKLKIEKEKKQRVKQQRIKLLLITLASIIGLVIIGFGVYWALFGKLAFENRNTYEAAVTFTQISSTSTQIEVVIDDIDFTKSNFEFYGIVFDMTSCVRPYCYDEVIAAPENWITTITKDRFVATITVNMPMSGMMLDIQYLEFNSQYFRKSIFVDRNKISYFS